MPRLLSLVCPFRRRQAVVGIDGLVDKIQADTMIPL
jgi:hypothetical protein